MNYEDLLNNHIEAHNALLTLFGSGSQRRNLLRRIGYPAHMMPSDSVETADFFDSVFTQIEGGILQLPNGFERLLQTAASMYPTSPAFAPFAVQQAGAGAAQHQPGQRNAVGESACVIVRGTDDVRAALAAARSVATALGRQADTITAAHANLQTETGVQIQLNGWTEADANRLAAGIRQRLNLNTDAYPSIESFPDYLIRRIFMEGPDQSRFDVSDVPASTYLRDLIRELMNTEYQNTLGGQNAAREVTVDRHRADGTTERLDADTTLHESDIRENDSLSVAPAAKAGSINPVLRDEALARVRLEMLGYAGSHPGFEVTPNDDIAPTSYTLRFTAPSFGPPGDSNNQPYLIEAHEVYVELLPDFPMQAPRAFWLTPIFHPNIAPNTGAVRMPGAGKVCLGLIEDRYRPGLDFTVLCRMLVDMAAYRNYAAFEGYNRPAMEWAVSDEGQSAITERGGTRLIDMLRAETAPPTRRYQFGKLD